MTWLFFVVFSQGYLHGLVFDQRTQHGSDCEIKTYWWSRNSKLQKKHTYRRRGAFLTLHPVLFNSFSVLETFAGNFSFTNIKRI
ncbi:UNVERIFIED_CONTAM: hypothetical protein FKN15_023232 [Acipenser sinensis]